MEAFGKYLDNLRGVVSTSRDALGGLGLRNSGPLGSHFLNTIIS